MFSLAECALKHQSLQFAVQDIKPIRIGHNVIELQYKLTIRVDNAMNYTMFNKMKLKDGKIVCIEPIVTLGE